MARHGASLGRGRLSCPDVFEVLRRLTRLRRRASSGTMRCLAVQRDDIEFDEWFATTFAARGTELPSQRIAELEIWAKRLFEANGPLSRDAVGVAYQFDQIRVVEMSVEKLLADLALVPSTVGSRVPGIAVNAYDNGLRVTVDGGYTEGSIRVKHPFDSSEATVEIVEYVREQLSRDRSVSFPVCSQHEYFYLHPVIDRGAAVWRCVRGEHTVAIIGELTDPA